MENTGVCLNVGCGLVVAQGWQNLDASPSLRIKQLPLIGQPLAKLLKAPQWPDEVMYGNIIQGLNIPENSCDLIYASHVLEHLALLDFAVAMEHIYSYLKPGGIFRAIVPNIEHFVKIYIEQKKDPNLAAQASFNLMQDSLMGHTGTRKSLLVRCREIFSNYRHQWMWDGDSLSAAFEKHGFKNVQIRQYGEWSDNRFAQVEHPESFLDGICLEGTKPKPPNS